MENPFMTEAIAEAKKGAALGEVPVGAVLVCGGEIIARAHNQTMEKEHILLHAEMLVMEEAIGRLGKHRLSDCSLYVTLEPCTMCAGAMLLVRPKRLYFGAYDPEAGACGGKIDVLSHSGIEVYGGLMERPCAALLSEFFSRLRKNR